MLIFKWLWRDLSKRKRGFPAEKWSRKTSKSRNRVLGIRHCDIPVQKKRRFEDALKIPQLMSSEESNYGEDGIKIFTVRPKNCESTELQMAKRLADETYMKKLDSTAAFEFPKARRVRGPPSKTPFPDMKKDLSWVNTEYGIL
ncbi:uncharacterized protein LOC125379266 [Haliotis rufescens]|uniref:uncharacterized protein LOC125379266 n=1 Tax=Haliotis rufescens TaxID=6454 RepID=UPI00201EEDA2|nr:uncharacterized protein LOC125379266 [Haliotis rufescens]